MDNKETKTTVVNETTGEDLLREYLAQDKDDSHHMGYSVYAQTHSEGCCC